MPRPVWNSPPYDPPNISLGGFVTLTNIGVAYDTITAARGLGMVELDVTGLTQLDWGVSVNKIGTGIQDWQLWNETDGAQLGVISDAGAAGNKTLAGTVTGLSLTGVKRIRIRARSSVAADDPLYYGGWLRGS